MIGHRFIKDTLWGGLALLPIAIIIYIYNWVAGAIDKAIEPLSPFLPEFITSNEFASSLLFITVSLSALFSIGLFLRTKIGSWAYNLVETKILIPYAPGYRFIQDSVKPFLPTTENKPFKHAVIAYPFENETFIVGFVTDSYMPISNTINNGEEIVIVFASTAPIPTSGMVYALPKSRVHKLENVSADDVLKPMISCGVGMAKILEVHETEISKKSKS